MQETVLYSAPQTADTATLYILDKSERVTEYSLSDYAKIGRQTPDSRVEVPLNSSIASRSHGEIQQMEGVYYYRDTDSLNGTYINGIPYGKNSPNKVRRLENGDVLRIDQKNLNRSHQDAVLIIFLLGNASKVWKTVDLGAETGDIEVGREGVDDNSLVFKDEALSRRHATFVHGMSGWSIMDHGSTNGVTLNHVRIVQPMPLHRLDVVQIANTTFLFLGDKLLYNVAESAANQLKIHIKQRSVRKFFRKQILLENIDLTIDPGEMVMVLGGSGAGKTTFFNAVMGYEKADGKIMQGDIDIYRDYSKVKNQIGYVPQQDLMRQDDLVFNTLENAARMKMPAESTEEQRLARIDYVLELLGLQREKSSLVRKLSGGQRKRLSIALELIADPSLFFLDEPDSGLDGVMARSLMENLRVIADDGKIVLVITHAPDRVAELFDKIIVLAKSATTNSGHMAFFGTVPEAKKFFDTNTLEGIVQRINRPDEGGDGMSDFYIDKYKNYIGGNK